MNKPTQCYVLLIFIIRLFKKQSIYILHSFRIDYILQVYANTFVCVCMAIGYMKYIMVLQTFFIYLDILTLFDFKVYEG